MGRPRRSTITRQRKTQCNRLCKVQFGIPAISYEFIAEDGAEDIVKATTEFDQSIVVSFAEYTAEAMSYADDETYYFTEEELDEIRRH